MTTNRVAIIIDGPNFWCSTNELGIRFSFPTFLNELAAEHFNVVIKKIYFDVKQTNQPENLFKQAMKKFGFEIISVPKKMYHHRAQENGKTAKSRTDAWILVDVTELLLKDEFDVLYIFTGDSDYEPLLKLVKSHGKQIVIVSAKDNLAAELRPFGDIMLLDDYVGTPLIFAS